MTNFQVYKKTIAFSFLMFAIELGAFILLAGLTVGGFFMFQALKANGIVGLIIGLVIGVIAAALIQVFITNRVKAAQIGMMAIGVTDGNLPEDTFHEGFAQLKGSFGRITAFYFITNAIKGIFRQLGRTINRVGTVLGGQTGNTVTSVIDSAVQTLIAYLCDCCLGWVLYHKNQNMVISACEGAVIFFKHGKTLIRNIGRIFGMGALSFILIGGAIFGLSFLIFYLNPNTFSLLAAEFSMEDTTLFSIIAAAVIAIILWSMIHSVVGRPFILVGVLRNFMAAGLKDKPTEADLVALDSKSPKFAKLRARAASN